MPAPPPAGRDFGDGDGAWADDDEGVGWAFAGAIGPVGVGLGWVRAALCSGRLKGGVVLVWSFEFCTWLATMRAATRAASAAHCTGAPQRLARVGRAGGVGEDPSVPALPGVGAGGFDGAFRGSFGVVCATSFVGVGVASSPVDGLSADGSVGASRMSSDAGRSVPGEEAPGGGTGVGAGAGACAAGGAADAAMAV
ncbi:hypothetical protein [Streptomyces sp. NPDC059894]|uniref:hypothetical protein n=1 Tax=unclassified Streptomyces TaxID=2593676 RepID=UPI0036592A58